MKKLLLIPLAIILIAGMCLSGCGEKGPEPGSVLRVSMPSFSYETFDPIQGESFFGWSIYDPLLTWDENFEICGAIADTWSVSEDGLTWTFNIRDDVTFHNGDPLTSADVMFSIQHWQDPETTNPWSPYLGSNPDNPNYNYDSQWCPDDYTYCYKTLRPDLAMSIIFTDVRILPKDYIEANGIEYFREHPIGSGPWMYVDGSFVSGDQVEFAANTEHWRTVPEFETIIQYVVPEESTQIAMLKRGDVDIVTGISLDRAVELRDGGWDLQQSAYPFGVVLCFPGTWLTDGPTSDINIRRAMAYSIDYEELCETYFHGFAEPGGRWFAYPGVWGWDDSWQPEPYDLAEVQSLLAAAGYPEAFDDPVIDVYVQTGTGFVPDMMQIVQSYWTEADIQTEIHMVDPFEYLGLMFFGALEGDNIGSVITWGYDISWPNNVYHSANMYCPGGVHSTSNDAQAQVLYTKAVSQTDPNLMEEYWIDFQTYVYDELFINFGVCEVWNQIVYGPEVGGFGYGAWISMADAYAGIKKK